MNIVWACSYRIHCQNCPPKIWISTFLFAVDIRPVCVCMMDWRSGKTVSAHDMHSKLNPMRSNYSICTSIGWGASETIVICDKFDFSVRTLDPSDKRSQSIDINWDWRQQLYLTVISFWAKLVQCMCVCVLALGVIGAEDVVCPSGIRWRARSLPRMIWSGSRRFFMNTLQFRPRHIVGMHIVRYVSMTVTLKLRLNAAER